MSLRGFRAHFSIIHLVIAVLAVDLIFCNSQEPGPDPYFEGVRRYEAGQYEQALQLFREALNEKNDPVLRYPQLHLKIAFCLFQTGRYEEAAAAFQSDSARLDQVIDYANFFTALSFLALRDTSRALREFRQLKTRHPQSPLVMRADSILANLYFAQKAWPSAMEHYQQLLRYPEVDKGEIYGRLVSIAVATRDNKILQDHAFELIRKHPFHPRSAEAYDELSRSYASRLYPQSKLRTVFDYLSQTKQFEEIDRLFDMQVKIGGQTALLRWLKIRKLYLQESYEAALQACRAQRNSFKGSNYLREIDLHIARCYLRLGFTEKAIEAYDTFQKRYPTDALAGEVLWVIAWLCEERANIDQARDYYKRLIVQYPRYEFVPEAHFRFGLSFYRQGDFQSARVYWASALEDAKDPFWSSRYKYWIAKTYARENDSAAYLAQLREISVEPFGSYYNLKAFLLTKDEQQIRQFVDSLVWEVHYKQVSYLPRYLDVFRRPLLVQDIFGEQYARSELNRMAGEAKTAGWEMVFAMGEMNERMQNFGRAYRLYRKIYDEKFSQKDWQAWIFLFKYLYPLYFNGEVNQYARQWNITPASIWAIIKKESAFEPYITSYANAYGLMQIIPPTANRLSGSLGVDLKDMRRLFDPNFNIFLGSYYLSELLKRYEGNLYYALAAYNAGEHRVDRWRKALNTEDDDFFMENIEFEQTRSYVRGVMMFYWTYHLLIHPYKVPDDLVPFPEKVAREPWFPEAGRFGP